MFLIVLLYALCASSFTICKAVLAYTKPIFFVGFRMTVAGLLLLLFARLRNEKVSINLNNLKLFVPLILFHIYFAYLLDLWSLQYVSSFKSSFFFNLSPFITAFLVFLLCGEQLSRNKIIGLSIGFIGLLPELASHAPTEDILGGIWFISWAEVAMLLAVASSCYGWIMIKKLLHQTAYSPFVLNGVAMFFGGILALLTSLIIEGWRTPPVTNISAFLLLTALIIIIVNLLFYNLYGYLLTRYSATFLSFAGFITPLWAALFGWLFLREHVSAYFFLATFIVIIGLYIFYQEELQKSF